MNLIIKWILYAIAIIFTAWIIPGIEVSSFTTALFVTVLLALINTFIKPVLLLITLPINFLTLGFFTLVINALLLILAGNIAPGFEINGFWSAFFGAIILSMLSIFINRIDDK